MLLLLIRHALTPATGQTLTGWLPGYHLSDRGREQVAALVEHLTPVRLDAIYASPIERTMETARPVAASKGLRVRVRRDLGEVRYGAWEGKRLKVLARTPLWKTVQQRPSEVRFPGGETLRETQARAVAALEEIAAAHRDQTVAAVTHADVIRLVAAHYAGVHIDLFQRLSVAPASVSAFWLGPGGPRVLALNHTADLSGFASRRAPAKQAGARRAPGARRNGSHRKGKGT